MHCLSSVFIINSVPGSVLWAYVYFPQYLYDVGDTFQKQLYYLHFTYQSSWCEVFSWVIFSKLELQFSSVQVFLSHLQRWMSVDGAGNVRWLTRDHVKSRAKTPVVYQLLCWAVDRLIRYCPSFKPFAHFFKITNHYTDLNIKILNHVFASLTHHSPAL